MTTLACLALALYVWMQVPALKGSMGLVEAHAWAPSLGIEYHLGVDGLGALMLVLSAIVTLMSVDAAHRVHHQPGLYFGLVLMLESGLFGSFTALNFFHWFLFWELSLIPAFFLIKLWGRDAKRACGYAVFCVHHGGKRGAAGGVSGGICIYAQHGLPVPDVSGFHGRSGRHAVKRSTWDRECWAWPIDDVARGRRAGQRFASEGAHDSVSHLAAGGLC